MATKLGIYQDAARIVADARLASLTDDVELRFAFDDAYAGAVTHVLRETGWRFAIVTANLSEATGSLIPGFTKRFTYPGDWLRTLSIFVPEGARECPVDLREIGASIYANDTGLVIRYVSTVGVSEALWTEQFASALAAYLAFLCAERITGDPARAQAIYSLYQSRLAEASQIDAEPVTAWMASQRDGKFLRAARTVLRTGFWRFAIKTAELTAGGSPVSGYVRVFAKPADWLRTQAAFVSAGPRECPVDLREDETSFSTDATALTIRYTSTDGLNSRKWTDSFYAAVKAMLIADDATGEARDAALKEVQAAVTISTATDGMPEDWWLDRQRDGTFLRASRTILRMGFWRFSTKTAALVQGGVPLAGFARSFVKPTGWLRTHSAFQVVGAKEAPVDLREEEGFFSTNAETLTIRYTADASLDVRTWPDSFYAAVKAALAIDAAGGESRDAAVKEMQTAVAISIATDGMVEDPWLASQRDGTLLRAAGTVLRMGYWRFAMKTATLSAGGTPAVGFVNAFAKPADWLGTQAAFTNSGARECPVDLREGPDGFSTNAPALTIRYTSSTGLDAKVWPETFHSAVKATLAAEALVGDARETALKEVRSAVGLSLVADGMGEDYWLQRQRDGSFLRATRMVLAAGFWRFSTKTRALDAGGTPVAGFTYAFPKPDDWVQTQAAFRPAGSREAPVDLREEETSFSANTTDLTIRYTSTDGLDARLWPDSFYAAVRAALRAIEASGEVRDAALKEMGAAVSISVATDGMEEDAWLDSQRNGTFQRAAGSVLEMGFWRFSTKTADLEPASDPVVGFQRAFAKPADWVQTHSAFVLDGDREAPVDLREEDAKFSTNATSLTIRYTSSDALDARAWPDSFYVAVKAALAVNVAVGEGRVAAIGEMRAAVAMSIATDGAPENLWMPAQRDGSFGRAARAVLEMGFWRFATKTTPLSEGGVPTAGFSRAFEKPGDWLRTLAAFALVDTREVPVALREEGRTFSTDAAALTIRYTSTDALDARTWPDSVYAAVRSALAANAATGEARPAALKEMQTAVAVSLATDGVPDDPWYRFQRTDAFAQGVSYVLSHGRWRFAVKMVDLSASGTPTSGMSYRYPLPADWLRTINLSTLRSPADDLVDVDFREEGGALHTDASPVTLRYITKRGLDATLWPEAFRDVVLAYLEYREARDDPNRANVAASKLSLYTERSKRAELKDDQSDRPRVNQVGRFVRGRFGGPYADQGRRW